MSVIRKKMELLILDDERFILLVDKEPPAELRGPMLRAACVLFDIKPADERKRLKAEPWLAEEPALAALPFELPDMDVIEPAPDRQHHMPRGITRMVTDRERYPEAAHPTLHPSAHKVLRAVADLNRSALLRDVRALIWHQTPEGKKKMPTGTVSSQLYQLSNDGYLLKQRNATQHALVYTLTDKGEDILTRPWPSAQASAPS